MANPTVSVVIPAYNAAIYLPKTIESILQQSFQDFEILVVNDGSTDDTVKHVSSFTDCRVKLINQENQGCATARNTGVLAAKGEYIAFLDSDDLWEPTKLEKQVQCLDKNPDFGLVYTWVDFSDREAKPTGKVRKVFAEGNVFQEMLTCNVVSCGSVPLVRRECFDTIGLFDTDLWTAEDKDLWLRISTRYPFGLIKEPLVYYRQHPSSKSSKGFKRREQDFQRIMGKVPDNLMPKNSLLWKKVYSQQYLYFAWRAYEGRSYGESIQYLLDAAHYSINIIFSKSFLHLLIILSATTLVGESNYKRLKLLLNSSR